MAQQFQTNFKGLHLHGDTSPPTHGESNKNGEAGPSEYRAVSLSFNSSADVGPFQEDFPPPLIDQTQQQVKK
ncbi:uncharacterized protein LACBIDRAFT_317633 [Laccaria bicolor S238N-H82]|uniref:Predicted protein n=1 Tax=Laccaria bicolor (strain S238N-H82 / ATCC MYA-4686) TaxID=486041 RepID=B0E235_LACBS|nr:uncharacterized protein LACBIDRAFT_317633 [Laccaria bicolor S238N-H82]EDQ99127.1 predicted protein [Laccaria bicolor S238N-H82]|eukprot:XP_001890260.1 predicted protein [Laccaria bicolor S238N-H82]